MPAHTRTYALSILLAILLIVTWHLTTPVPPCTDRQIAAQQPPCEGR